MEFLDFLFGSSEKRSSPPPDDDFWYSSFGLGAGSQSYVSPEAALAITAVYACVRILAEDVGSLPLPIYRRLDGGGKQRDTSHPLYKILQIRPNKWMTKMNFWEMMIGHVALRGNAYARILRSQNQNVIELIPLHPGRMRVGQFSDGTRQYLYTDLRGMQVLYPQSEIFHLQGLSSDGLVGLSPLDIHQRTFEGAITSDDYSTTFFKNQAQPGGLLMHPKILTPTARENLKKSWQEMHGGANRGRVAVLEEGLEWKQVGITQKDAQWLETKKYTKTDIASIFRMPPHMIGDLERATFSNIEQQSLEYVRNTLRPWLVRVEETILRDLISEREQTDVFAEFIVEGLLRGDIQARYNSYSIGLNNGFLNADEVRAYENLNPIPNGSGQTFRVPLNTAPSDDPFGDDNPDPTSDDDGDSSDDADSSAQRSLELLNSFKEVFEDIYARSLRREWKLIEKEKQVDEDAHRKSLSEDLLPAVRSLCKIANLTESPTTLLDSLLTTDRETSRRCLESKIDYLDFTTYKQRELWAIIQKPSETKP